MCRILLYFWESNVILINALKELDYCCYYTREGAYKKTICTLINNLRGNNL